MARPRKQPPPRTRGGKRGTHASPGAGSVYQVQSGRDTGAWRGAAWVTRPDGVRLGVFVTGSDEADARSRLAHRRAEAEGQPLPPGDSALTVSQWIARWLGAEVKDQRRPGTYDSYLDRAIHVERYLGRVALRELAPAQVQWMLSELRTKPQPRGRRTPAPLSATTAGRVLVLLRSAVKAAARDGVLERDPLQYLRAPRPDTAERETYSDDELTRLLTGIAASGHPLALLYELLATVGLRRGEAIGLRWQDVDLAGAALNIRSQRTRNAGGVHTAAPKTSKGRRRIPLSPELVEQFREHEQRQRRERMAAGTKWTAGELVFTLRGAPVSPETVGASLRRLCAQLGIRHLPPHALRHTVATQLLRDGVPVTDVAELLGHTPAVTMTTYAHVIPGGADAAILRRSRAISPRNRPVDADVVAMQRDNHA